MTDNANSLLQTPSQASTPSQAPLLQTPSQTIGPFFGYALPYAGGPQLVEGYHPDAIRLHGTVLDGAGHAVPDALLELWQPDASGAIPDARGSIARDGFTFTGFGRVETDLAGHFTFTTVRPGTVLPGRAPYALLTIFARGMTQHLFTRVYFPGDDEALAADRLLNAVASDRRHTLVAVAEPDAAGRPSYRFDVNLQGENETVFLEFGD